MHHPGAPPAFPTQQFLNECAEARLHPKPIAASPGFKEAALGTVCVAGRVLVAGDFAHFEAVASCKMAVDCDRNEALENDNSMRT